MTTPKTFITLTQERAEETAEREEALEEIAARSFWCYDILSTCHLSKYFIELYTEPYKRY